MIDFHSSLPFYPVPPVQYYIRSRCKYEPSHRCSISNVLLHIPPLPDYAPHPIQWPPPRLHPRSRSIPPNPNPALPTPTPSSRSLPLCIYPQCVPTTSSSYREISSIRHQSLQHPTSNIHLISIPPRPAHILKSSPV